MSQLANEIDEIVLNQELFRNPKMVTLEIRSKDPFGFNYTLENNIKYSNLDFSISDAARYAAIPNSINTLPAITVTQNKGSILQKGDTIAFTFITEGLWKYPKNTNEFLCKKMDLQ